MSAADRQDQRPGDSDPSGDELLKRVRQPRSRTLTSYARRDVRNTIANATRR